MIVASEYPIPPLRKSAKLKAKRTAIRKVDVLRVIRAATSAGIPIRTLEVTCEGTIRVSSEALASKSEDIFDQWEHRL